MQRMWKPTSSPVGGTAPRGGLWLPAIVSVLAMLSLFGLVFAWQWHADHSAERLTPHGERLFVIFCFAAPCVPALAALWAALSRRIVTRLTVVLGLLLLLGLAMPVVFLGVLPPLFGGHYTKSSVSPDGTREAHVRIDGLLGCSATLYICERRAIWALAGESRNIACDTETITWLPDGSATLEAGPAQPLMLDLGPH
jgi:hypothetical protein